MRGRAGCHRNSLPEGVRGAIADLAFWVGGWWLEGHTVSNMARSCSHGRAVSQPRWNSRVGANAEAGQGIVWGGDPEAVHAHGWLPLLRPAIATRPAEKPGRSLTGMAPRRDVADWMQRGRRGHGHDVALGRRSRALTRTQ